MTDPVANANRIAMLLRQRLLDRARAASGRRTGPQQAPSSAGIRPQGGIAAAALCDGHERSVRRAVIERILADQLGEGLLNDALFQQLVQQVSDVLEGDAAGSALLSRVVDDLRSAPR